MSWLGEFLGGLIASLGKKLFGPADPPEPPAPPPSPPRFKDIDRDIDEEVAKLATPKAP